eukprot:scaffold28563_cov19-Phaeocystis_antarctica.AAC.1
MAQGSGAAARRRVRYPRRAPAWCGPSRRVSLLRSAARAPSHLRGRSCPSSPGKGDAAGVVAAYPHDAVGDVEVVTGAADDDDRGDAVPLPQGARP